MTIIIWMWWIKGLVGGMSVTAEDASLCFIYLCVTQLLAQTPHSIILTYAQRTQLK